MTRDERERLLSAAKSVIDNAYAPYSGFRVGAAVLTEQGDVYAGCNVENASYGLTICAERAAISSAVTGEGGQNLRIRAVAVFSDSPLPFPPCGACRQVMYEFGSEATVVFQGPSGLQDVSMSELLPSAFRIP